MADDSSTTLVGSAATAATFDATTDGGGNRTLQSTPRTNGAIVSATNPLPTRTPDGMDAAEGTTTDTAWVSGAGTVISILKGIFGRLAGLLTINVTQIAGSAIQTGAGLAAGAIRIAWNTEQTLLATITGSVNQAGTWFVSQGGVWNVGAVVAPTTAAHTGGTITTTGTFYQALPANSSRVGGLIQNTGTGIQFIYLGGTAAAQSAGTAVVPQLGPLDAFNLNCGIAGGRVHQGAVSITGPGASTWIAIENT